MSVSDPTTGAVSNIALTAATTSEETLALHNGSEISVTVRTGADITGVMLRGSALSSARLRRGNEHDWQGVFKYWDASNSRHSTSQIEVLLISGNRTIERSLAVTTVHDS
jgi:hypothetical protein